GGSLPAEIFQQVMRAASAGVAPSALPGTILSDANSDTGNGFGSSPIFASNGTHIPRVVQYHEVLPWASDRSVQEVYHPTTRTLAADAEVRPMSHPMKSIGEDFIARAVASESSASSPTMADGERREESRDARSS